MNQKEKEKLKTFAVRDWEPSQKDIDWRYMSKEKFLKKYPEEARWYCPPPSTGKFIW